jgi:predicted HAD superfamily phosphohydrolase
MQPITYWVQNDTINTIVDNFGPHLAGIPLDERRNLIALLAVPSIWNTLETSEDLDDLFELLEPLTRDDKDKLIEAIAANLHYVEIP